VAGRSTTRWPRAERIYDQMLEPKWVISMGACACSGGFYNNYTVLQGIDRSSPSTSTSRVPSEPEGIIDAVVRSRRSSSRRPGRGPVAIK